MKPTIDVGRIAAMIVVTFLVLMGVLLFTFMRSTVRQQRRYLRTRDHLGGRLLRAQDEERAALARELHDDTLQRLIAAASQIRSSELPAMVPIASDLDTLIDDIRGLARGIHPASVDKLGLGAALAELCRAFGEREGIAVEFIGNTIPDSMTQAQRLGLFRVAQEALGNVARHADVDSATVDLLMDDSAACVRITDKGAGFEGNPGEQGMGIGVTSMRERMAILGGTLEIASAPGEGTEVKANLPLSKGAA